MTPVRIWSERTDPAHIAKGCEGKYWYADKPAAKIGAKVAKRIHGGRRLLPYKCLWCDGWHLTSKRPGDGR